MGVTGSEDNTESPWLPARLAGRCPLNPNYGIPPADSVPLTAWPGLPHSCPSPACCRFFLPTAAPMILSSSSSEAPARRWSRRDTSEFPKRQTYGVVMGARTTCLYPQALALTLKTPTV